MCIYISTYVYIYVCNLYKGGYWQSEGKTEIKNLFVKVNEPFAFLSR